MAHWGHFVAQEVQWAVDWGEGGRGGGGSSTREYSVFQCAAIGNAQLKRCYEISTELSKFEPSTEVLYGGSTEGGFWIRPTQLALTLLVTRLKRYK